MLIIDYNGLIYSFRAIFERLRYQCQHQTVFYSKEANEITINNTNLQPLTVAENILQHVDHLFKGAAIE